MTTDVACFAMCACNGYGRKRMRGHACTNTKCLQASKRLLAYTPPDIRLRGACVRPSVDQIFFLQTLSHPRSRLLFSLLICLKVFKRTRMPTCSRTNTSSFMAQQPVPRRGCCGTGGAFRPLPGKGRWDGPAQTSTCKGGKTGSKERGKATANMHLTGYIHL